MVSGGLHLRTMGQRLGKALGPEVEGHGRPVVGGGGQGVTRSPLALAPMSPAEPLWLLVLVDQMPARSWPSSCCVLGTCVARPVTSLQEVGESGCAELQAGSRRPRALGRRNGSYSTC